MKSLLILVSILAFTNTIQAMRVISMSPTITEILYALEVRQELVGVSRYCQYPKQACQKESVGTAITPNLEKIIALNPEFILSQEIKNKSLNKLSKKLNIKMIEYQFNSFVDIMKSIKEIGVFFEKEKAVGIYNKLSEEFNSLKNLKKKGRYLAVIETTFKMGRLHSFLVASDETFYCDILDQTGLKNVSQGKKESYFRLSVEEFISLNADKIFIFSREKEKHKELIEKEIKKFKLNTKVYEFYSDYAVIPGPRLGLLMKDISNQLSDR